MILPETTVDTVCMYVVMVGFTITPLLETCFTVSESYSIHTASSTFREASCALKHHLRHLPPIVRLGVAMSCTIDASGMRAS